MKKVITITLLVLLTVGLFVSCNADAVESLFDNNKPEPPSNEFTVTFDTNGGSDVANQKVKEGEKATKPSNPMAAGLIFKGWYKEEACTNEWNFYTDTVTAHTILYAKWAKTVGYVIGNSFPEKGNAWTSDGNCICYYDSWSHALVPALCFFNNTSGGDDIFMYLNNEIEEATNGYIYRNDIYKYTVTFIMNGNNLQSIVFSADSDAEEFVKAVNGTYTQPSPTPTT